ncbi:MAG: sulfatase-like hydrolase/transferase [Fimbriimonadaceae bacterium]|nr:sulfatase-like hydrolase/transferase [Fimbriimonadaceae bacterium]
MNRRTALAALAALPALPRLVRGAPRPNFLWLSCEDTSPTLGCYGDAYADTPHLDALAADGVRYLRCFTHAGVCAPSRSGLITGCYPGSIGSCHMRNQAVPPPEVRCFPELLRAAGYWCSNNSKTDYQFAPPPGAWDECHGKAHWQQRAAEQPFFSVFNLTVTHEGQVRNLGRAQEAQRASLGDRRHDPARAPLPTYYVDTPVVRRAVANYYDHVTLMDQQCGELLAQLAADGLRDNTIIWFWGDHGWGLPRGKRWLYDSGIRAPLLVWVPPALRSLVWPDGAPPAGSSNDQLVAFLDFAPTLLTLAGLPAGPPLVGQPFLGPARRPPRQYVYATRDRMDETYDHIRSVRDERFKYLRNYCPHLSRAEPVAYGEVTALLQELRRAAAAGRLNAAQAVFFEPRKPVEELYDTVTDPEELHNLAADPAHRATLLRLRAAHAAWREQSGDIGLVPEAEFNDWQRPGGQPATTAAPGLRATAAGDGWQVELHCQTRGASLRYRLDEGRWQLYTTPVRLPRGVRLTWQASRIGYQPSAERTWREGPATVAAAPATDPPPWRERCDPAVLRRLWALKDLQLTPGGTTARVAALADPAPPVRYWAVIDLLAEGAAAAHQDRLRPLLADPSPSVQCAAAEALGPLDPAAVAQLGELLRRTGAIAVMAGNALWHLGDAVRPLLPLFQDLAPRATGDLQKLLHRLLQRCGVEPPAPVPAAD